jgi:hypothetical protein
MKRLVGQVIRLEVDSSSKLYEKYQGYWFIQRIYTEMADNNYINTIIACRIDERK